MGTGIADAPRASHQNEAFEVGLNPNLPSRLLSPFAQLVLEDCTKNGHREVALSRQSDRRIIQRPFGPKGTEHDFAVGVSDGIVDEFKRLGGIGEQDHYPKRGTFRVRNVDQGRTFSVGVLVSLGGAGEEVNLSLTPV